VNTLIGRIEKLSDAISHYSNESVSLNQIIQAAKALQKYLHQNPLLEEAPELASLKQHVFALTLLNLPANSKGLLGGEDAFSDEKRQDWKRVSSLEKGIIDVLNRLKPELNKFRYLFEFINFSSSEKISPTLRYGTLQEAYEVFLSRKSADSDWQKIRVWVDRDIIRAERSSVQWQEAVSSFLTESEKRTLEGAYYALMEEPIRRDRLHDEAMKLIELAIKAVFLKLLKELEKGVITAEEANLQVLKTYNHFALSMAYVGPQRMLSFDVIFSKQMSQVFRKGSPLEVKDASTHLFLTRPEYRNEYLKLLLIQQILITAGTAFAMTAHLDSAVRFLGEHRTMMGQLMHRVFGVKTRSLEIYEDYQRTLDPTINPEQKKTLVEQIQSKIRFKTARLRKLFSEEESVLIERKFTEAQVHSKGISFVAGSPSGVCVTA
jgi:hypothetical protein